MFVSEVCYSLEEFDGFGTDPVAIYEAREPGSERLVSSGSLDGDEVSERTMTGENDLLRCVFYADQAVLVDQDLYRVTRKTEDSMPGALLPTGGEDFE